MSGGLVMSASCQDSLGNKSDLLEQVEEAITITHCEVSQYLAVELDTVLDHRSDESGVRRTSVAAGCGDTSDPEAAEVALLVAAVTVSIVSRFCNGFVCNLENVLTCSEVTLGGLDNLLVTLVRHHTTFNTRHFSLFLSGAGYVSRSWVPSPKRWLDQSQESWAACRPTTNLVGCTIWQLTANSDALSRMESSFVVQPATAPRGLLNHRMGPLGVPMHQLAGPGLMEPLYGSLVRLHFRHGFYPLTDGNTVILPNEGCYHNRD